MSTTERLKVLWAPGLAALLLSLLSLRVLPGFFPLSGLVFPLGIRIHYPSFLALVAIGGLAAYASRHLGGGAAHRIIAALFPALWEVLRTLIWWVATAHLPSVSHLLFLSLNRVVFPSIALLIGAALFLRDSRKQSVPA